MKSLGHWSSGGTPSRRDAAAYGGSIPWIKIGDLKDGPVTTVEETITEQGLQSSSARLLKPGTLLIAMYGASIGKLGITTEPCATNQAIAACKPFDGIDLRYLFHFALHQRKHFTSLGQGGAQPNISQTILKDERVPVAPEQEQKRIVSKIDELFSSIEEGERALERVRKLVERYRQSVLKAAVTGDLTREWREQHADQLESGDALLTRILSDRRQDWERDKLARARRKGNRATEESSSSRYKAPLGPQTEQEDNLPEGWTLCSGAQLFEWSSGDFLPKEAMRPGVVPVYGGNGTNGHHNAANVSLPTLVVGRVGVHCGNVHMTEGKAWITDNAIFASYCPGAVSLAFMAVCLRASELGSKAQGGAQPFVNQKALNETVIPLPSVAEQIHIVEEWGVAMTNIDAILRAADAESHRALALKQAILRSAFSGQLVAQDFNDEPASALLERIAEERAAAAPRSRAGTTSRRRRA